MDQACLHCSILLHISNNGTVKKIADTKCLNINVKILKKLAEDGFDPSTSGLWAQHASTAPLCFLQAFVIPRQATYATSVLVSTTGLLEA